CGAHRAPGADAVTSGAQLIHPRKHSPLPGDRTTVARVSSQYPESQDRPLDHRPPTPAAGGLRASDQDRNQVANVLSAAYAEGRLTREEHDERLEQAMSAKTFDELI